MFREITWDEVEQLLLDGRRIGCSGIWAVRIGDKYEFCGGDFARRWFDSAAELGCHLRRLSDDYRYKWLVRKEAGE